MASTKKPRTRNAKRIMKLDLSSVFIASNAKQRTYIEQIEIAGTNFTQKHLGTICGYFVVRDKSSWSAHIVHFLTAEFKKEYFALPKRTLTESFIAALHHTNRALAELAKNDNINWIGMLDSVLVAYDETSIYFSVTGNGYILLLRDGELINIGEGLAPDPDNASPLKTFIDTASGKVLPGDKIIITSSELLELIPYDELRKNAERFSPSEFLQFVSTVLTNECDMASTQIIDVREKPVMPEMSAAPIKKDSNDGPAEEEPLPENAFSAKSFSREKKSKGKSAPTTAQKTVTPDEGASEESAPDGDYTDKRTGHIYVAGDHTPGGGHPISAVFDHTKDIASDALYSSRKQIRKSREYILVFFLAIPQYSRKAVRKVLPAVRSISPAEKFSSSKDAARSILGTAASSVTSMRDTLRPTPKENVASDVLEKLTYENASTEKPQQHTPTKKPSSVTKPKELKVLADDAPQRLTESTSKERIELLTSLYTSDAEKESDQESNDTTSTTSSSKSIAEIGRSIGALLAANVKKVIPSFHYDSTTKNTQQRDEKSADLSTHDKTSLTTSLLGLCEKCIDMSSMLWRRVTVRQKLIALAILIAVFVIPWIRGILTQRTLESTQAIEQQETFEEELAETVVPADTQPPEEESVAEDNSTIADPTIISKNTSASAALQLGGTLLFPRGEKILSIAGPEITEEDLPDGSGNIVHATIMDAVKLMFFITDKDLIYAYDPKTSIFTEQSIARTLDHTEITGMSTYQRKLYVADRTTVTRYDRAIGGFDNSTEWITDGTTLNDPTAIAIDGNVYIAQNGSLSLFDGGKKVNRTLDANIKPTLLYTTEGAEALWILDIENVTLHKVNASSFSIQESFRHEELRNAVSFSVDELNAKAYIAHKNEIVSYTLKNN